MRFHTHDRTPKIETNKTVKILLAVNFGLIASLFLFFAVVCSIYSNSIMPAILILIPLSVLATFIAITQKDMDKAYIEIADDRIMVADYYFGIQCKKIFSMSEIGTAEILTGHSMQVRGYRYCNAGCDYIVFKDHRGKYMFKVISVPETKKFFSKYLNQAQA